MDEYDKKFAEMQKYIPFLEAMIERLQKVKDKSREAQLQKMQSLHGILSNSKRKLRIETLQRCEDVLQKLHNKVEKGNAAGLNPSHKKPKENSSQNTSSKEATGTESSAKLHIDMMDETPASPSPTASPDHMTKSTPIIIPMERRDEANISECDSKPASPDQCEHIPVTAPIIIPTERKDDCKNDQSSTNHNSNNCGSDSNDLFSEWEMLEESENQINKSRRSTWQSVIAPGTDVATAAKLVCNNFPQKVIPEGRPMVPRHIPTVPAPSSGGLRRIISVFDKNRLSGLNASSMHSETRSESPVNVQEVRLKSPDPDMLFPRLKITSPRQKEGVNLPKLSPKPSTPLLVSPPSVLTEPPLSIEDLAELLSDEGDGTKNDKQNKDSVKLEEQSKTTKEVGGEDVGKSKREVLPGKHQLKNHKDSNESKVPNSFVLTQEDIDRESERRWEEIDKHIVKLTARRCLPNKHTISPLSVRLESSKSADTKVVPSPPRISQPLLSPGLLGVDKSADHRNRPPSPLQNVIKEKENEKEHRYADNYERHPRQFRDAHDSGDDTKDKNIVSSNLSRITDDQSGIMGYPNLRNNTEVSTKSDDSTRNLPLYQRRSQPNLSADAATPLGRTDDYRRENVDYFARKAAAKMKRPPLLPSPVVSDFPNNQWGSTPSYSGNIRPPLPPASNAYQRNSNNSNFHQDMWQMGQPACASVDFHQMNETESRIPQFNPHPPVRPLANSTPRQQDINRGMNSESGFREEAAGPAPVMQPLLSPPGGFPAGTQYRNPRMENRSYDASYDRSSDISQTRHTWDTSSTRVSDVGYRRDSESSRGRLSTDGPNCRPGTPAPYTRPGTPAPLWTRDRERSEKDWNRRGRGRERYYNDRGRSESRIPFNRDSRKAEWERDGHNDRDNRVRLNRDNRVSERDPRVRPEQRPQSPVPPKETVTTTTVRDPRLIKDISNVVDKPKDTVGSSSDRDPRRRPCETKSTRKTSPTGIQPKAKDKPKTQKSIDHKNRRDSELEDATSDKMSKDKLHSPLESLYGVIDTKAKTGQGYGLQKFKIPKIKRSDPPPPPPKTETVIPEIKIPEPSSSSMLEQLPETSCQSIKNEKDESDQNKRKTDEEIEGTDDATSTVLVNTLKSEQANDMVYEIDNNTSATPKLVLQIEDGIPQQVATSTGALSKESGEQMQKGELSKESDVSKPKEEVTKELIEALIRKSFEFGQGKQLFDQAKLLHKLGEALHAKKLKKIKKIIESDSESSSSSKDEQVIETRKTQGKKKRRVIFSDSSEEESLADRLGLLKDSMDEQNGSNETLKEETEKKTKGTTKAETQIEINNTPEIVSKIDDEKESENPDKTEETCDTSAAVEEVAVPVVRKKRSYKKRGKGAKKVEPNVEDPVLSEPSEWNPCEEDPKADENKEIEKKPPQKIKNKRRNSLEMLQEDIREMFICEGVVTATGHRMCRLIKEGHADLNSTIQNPNSAGGASERSARRSDDKQNTLVNSDSDESTTAEQSKKDDSILITRGRAKTSKATEGQTEDAKKQHMRPQKRTSKRVTKVLSRQYVDSSESEDEPLINSLTRSESLKLLSDSEPTTLAEQSETQQKSETSPLPETQKSEESQTVMFLRRSKRVPKVLVEKTEITKLDSSKMMFDSSSDESFGIDVSELAAAVDISLHPEPQSHPDPATAESLKASRIQTRRQTTVKNKQTSKKNKSTKIIEERTDDTMSFTDEGSILSDISMSSSITSIKKITRNSNSRNSTKGQQYTNEELLSNILIGLTAKSTPEKSTDEIDKESDVDADEELDESLCETSEGVKKGVTKRKKKKFNWQLGILSKKKRKKKASAPISPVIPTSESEFANPSECLNKSEYKDNDNAAENSSFDSLDNSETGGLSKKNESSEDKNESAKLDSGLEECHDTDIVEPKKSKSSLRKPRRKVALQDETNVGIEHQESEDSINNETSGITKVDTLKDLNPSEIEMLLEYAWTGQERYKCMLCTFTGKNIVHHYKLNHPEDEVLISRLVPANAKLAIEEASDIDKRSTATKLLSGDKFKYNCRFCVFCTSGTRESAKEAFYEHCTIHTGEYRYKCVSCPYQTIAKSSVKSHYYKVCRKFADNVSVAIIEDSIPDEDSIHGYICSICNFVQLKRSTIENHMVSKHSKNSDAKCIQINMSLNVDDGSNIESHADVTNADNLVEIENLSALEKDQKMITNKSDHSEKIIEIIENKDTEEVQIKDVENKEEASMQEVDVKPRVVQETNFAETSSQIPKDLEKVENVAIPNALANEGQMEIDSNAEKTSVSFQQESEALPVNGNLSVFVCPPEVAIKEHEIQLERKKKMQEIVENIGIKVNKDGTKQPLSIIDKLKVKMDTNSRIDIDQNVMEKNVDNVLTEPFEMSESNPTLNSSELDMEGNLSNAEPSESSTDSKSSNEIPNQPSTNVKQLSDCPEVSKSEDNMDKSLNNLESKMKDPLTTFDDSFQNFGSDTETSDTEMMSTFVQYESDSSNDQSESQISQDVNSLLKETTTDNNAPAKGLMHITIQRLAAQLKNAKTGSPSQSLDDSQVKVERSDEQVIPKAPDVVPLSSVKRLWSKQKPESEEIKYDQLEASSPPKTLIRIRRLSGDKLSVPSNPVELLEENQLSSTEGSASDLGTGVLQTDTEEECSFLRIENVVSLAPAADDAEDESSIISDIRKAVETSPIKPRISILKKSPIILHKVGNRSVLNQRLMSSINNSGESVKIIPVKSLPSTSQTPKQVLANIVPMQSTSKIQATGNLKKPLFVPTIMKKGAASTIGAQIQPTGTIGIPGKSNFKIIKLTRTATSLKHKECVAQSFAMKLKSPESYKLMLKPAKLCHLFKCMARDCSYTTNSLELFKNHYEEHMTASIMEKVNQSFGYCAYCCVVLEDWNLMEKHLLNRHAHCRFQCSYCFYRAVTQSYVELHQAISHPGHLTAVLEGKAMGDNIPHDCIEHSEIVKPFICQQECGKSFYIPETFITHLKTKHGPLLSMFKCHLCPATCLKPEKLISHYKMHGIYKYQCMYCLNGSDVSAELHNHLSNFHCNLPPCVIERTLLPQASSSQDVIDQLVIKNVEDDFKYTDLVTNIEEIPEENWQLPKNLTPNDGLNSSEISTDKSFFNDKDKGGKISLLKRNLYSRFCDNNDGDSNITGEAVPQLIIQHSKDDESLSNRISIPEMDDFDEYSLQVNIDVLPDRLLSDKVTENNPISHNLLKNGSEGRQVFEYSASDIIDNHQTVRNSQKLVQQTDFGETLFVINNPVEPLSLPESSNCSNQFVNNNDVENTETLGKSVKNEHCTSLSVSKDATLKKAENYEDSDIEILEDLEIVKKSTEKESKISQEVDTRNQILKNDPITSDKVEEPHLSVANSNADDLHANTDSNTTTETSMEIVQPLTLDDIKDTGFTGSDLYKCGNDDCGFSAETVEFLKSHLTSCTAFNEGNSLSCAHCKKRFVKVGFLLEHLKTHSLKRFGCSLCKMRCTLPHQAMSHMKSKHKYGSNKLVPADPKNPSTDGLFVVQPIRGGAERGRGKKRTPTKATDKDTDRCIDVEKLSFNPDEIDTLPRQAIYNREAMCAVCPYSTKVRTNMVRHLQLHAKDATVPESGPVNPVPCLDKKERMFDKMVNLASSSHQNGRMGGKTRENSKEKEDDSSLPKFVPEHKRYVCGVAECNYLTVDDTMLRCHLKALHSDEPYFRCPHCPLPQPGQETQNIGIDKMGIHLKMHDNRLYKCSHCNHHHYHRHVVERHLSDKHAEKRPFVKVIREPETIETAQAPQDEVEDEGPDRDGNHWKCNMCDYKCMYKNEMISHASTEHDERSQFKCTECSYKTTGKINVEQHFVSRHPNEPQIKYDMVYQKIKGGVKKLGEPTDQGTIDEPFDTTPLWRRDMPRVRHIRGILLEEEEAAAANDSPTKGTKRKSEGGDVSTKPVKSRPGKSSSGEIAKLSDEKIKVVTPKTPDAKKGTEPNSPVNERVSKTRAVDKLRLLDKSENEKLNESLENPVTDTSYSEEFSELSDSEMGQFGPYGKPNGSMYVCTLCNYFETRYKHDLRDHLYRELKYKKWHCRACGFLSVNKHTLVKHFSKQHPGEHPDHEMLTPDNSIEEWVTTLLQRQTNIIKGLTNKSSPRINADKTTSSGLVQASTQSKKSAKAINSIVQSALKTMEDNSKTVDLTHAISNLKDSTIDMDMDLGVDDEDSRDNNDLVIDLKDDNLEESDIQHEKVVSDKSEDKKEVEKRLTCKHCNMKFARLRGFKLHVQVTHLKRLSFLCPYCDKSANSEMTMRQHVRSKHAAFVEKVIHNPTAGGPELTNEFWEKEYGLICPNKKVSRKRKRKPSTDDLNKLKDDTDRMGSRDICNLCGFTALNLTGLKAHMRIHANKSTMKCAYCTFSGSIDAEVRQHWKINHAHFPFKVEDLTMAGPSSQKPTLQQQTKGNIEEYSDDIEEEQVPSVNNAVEKLTYCCFYCSLHSSSLETVRTHWQRSHKEPQGPNELGNRMPALPFRYKQVNAQLPLPSKLSQCGYCQKKAGKATLRVHMRRKHSKLPPLFVKVPEVVQEGWICQWCNEFCETETKMKHHQNMFHSHLPLHFKKQETEEQPKGYSCPECPFTSMSTVLMKKHVAKHVNLFKCKYCDTTFTTPSLVASHSTQVHPGSELKIESISNYDSLVEQMMAKVLWSNSKRLVKTETVTEETQVVSPLKKNAVAKKSTAKQPLRVMPSPNKMRCVARKSTNSLSRYPPGLHFRTDDQCAETSYFSRDTSPSRRVEGFSYYGLPSSPISLASLSTYMSVGGHQMKVNCTKLGQLMNINPRVLVKDLKQDVKSLSAFSNRI